jgi:hypothetical protein
MAETLTAKDLLDGIRETRLVAIVRGTDPGDPAGRDRPRHRRPGRSEGSPRSDGGGIPLR